MIQQIINWINQPAFTSADSKMRPLWKSCLYDYFYPAIWCWKKLQNIHK